MENVYSLEDHRLLKYEAQRQDLSYTEYRRKLRLFDIDLETAITNTKRGISIEDFAKQRYRTGQIKKAFKIASGAIGTGLIALAIYLTPSIKKDSPSVEATNPPIEKYSKPVNKPVIEE